MICPVYLLKLFLFCSQGQSGAGELLPGLILPVVAQIDSVRVEHGNDFKDHMITQDLGHRMFADQEVNKS